MLILGKTQTDKEETKLIWYVKGSEKGGTVDGKGLGGLFDPVMDVIAMLKPDYLTIIESQVMSARREVGVYHYRTAEGRLEKANITGSKDNSGWGYRLCLRFKKVRDAQKLHDMVFSGSIRPEISYDGEQSGKSRSELEQELQYLRTLTNTLSEDYGEEKDRNRISDEKLRSLHLLANSLELDFWPFCHKKGVAESIKAILTTGPETTGILAS